MTSFRISKGLEANLPATKTDGRLYFCTDTGNLYIDYKGETGSVVRKLVDKSKFDELNDYIGSELSNIRAEIDNINGTYIGSEPPEDTNVLWIDTDDESQDGGYDLAILDSKIDSHDEDINSHSDIRKIINSLPTKEYVDNAIDEIQVSDVSGQISQHNQNTSSHADIRTAINSLPTKQYVDNAISQIPTPDVSGQINQHNEDINSHSDIRNSISEIAEEKALKVKNDLLNGAGAAYDTLKELGDLIDDNIDAITALEAVATSKQDTVIGGASTITKNNLTASRALISNGNGKVAVSDITSTELGYLDGVTSNIQTQLNNINSTLNGVNTLLDTILGEG